MSFVDVGTSKSFAVKMSLVDETATGLYMGIVRVGANNGE